MTRTEISSTKKIQSFLTRYSLNLNAQQQEALARIDGPTLLLAVPGSGKTTVVICRLGYMTEVLNIPPEKILTLTFSRAAARDLAGRFEQFFPDAKKVPSFSTIHSFSLGVIRTYEKMNSRRAFEILDNPTMIIRGLFSELFKGLPGENEMAEILSGLTYARNMLLSDDEIAKMKVAEIDFLKLYKAYADYKKRHHLMDFDDMLVYALGLLKREGDLLKRYTDRFQYIHLDEAQDTSKVQFEILHLLAKKHGNIFMVGDEDQSIYGFRGAFPKDLLNFNRHYPTGKVLLMETNYRSTGKLVKAADAFIAKSEERYEKHMITGNPHGEAARCVYVPTLSAQYRKILDYASGNEDIAVLYRNNESVIPLADLFEREGVPYRLKEHNPLFFTHFLVTDMKKIWDFAHDLSDVGMYKKIYFKMDGSISKANIKAAEWKHQKEDSVFTTLLNMPSIADWQRKKLRRLRSALKRLLTLPGKKLIDHILVDCGYQNHLDYRVKQGGLSAETVEQKLEVLRFLAAKEPDGEAFFARLEKLEKLMSEQRLKRPEGILFSTIHSAKGLEFDHVVMIDAVDGEFPPRSALEKTPEADKDYQEEMRLFYVGVTRAKKELTFIIVGKKGMMNGLRPVSRFITQYTGEKFSFCSEDNSNSVGKISEKKKEKTSVTRFDVKKWRHAETKKTSKPQSERIKWQPNMFLKHNIWGDGRIVQIQKGIATVAFDCGEKKLDLAYCEESGVIKVCSLEL